MNKVLPISSRGQITIPAKSRRKFKNGYVFYEEKGDAIVLRPLKTEAEFWAELDEAEKDWEKNGGIPWEEVMKKSDLLP